MSDMFPDTPMNWDTTAEKPPQDSSVPPQVKTSEDKQGHGTHIYPPSQHDVSIVGPKRDNPTISKSVLPQILALKQAQVFNEYEKR